MTKELHDTLRKEFDDVRIRHHQSRTESLRKRFGPLFEAMSQSSTLAANSIHDPDPFVRLAALSILKSIHGKDLLEPIAEDLLFMVFKDVDFEVRTMAIYCVRTIYSRTKDQSTLRKLALLVRDTTQDICVRRAGLEGLYEVDGHPVESWPGFFSDDFDISKDVDWHYVDRFIS